MHKDWASVALSQAGLTVTTVSNSTSALLNIHRFFVEPERRWPHNVAKLTVLFKKTKEEHLLQTPGIEPGTVCAANRANIATNC